MAISANQKLPREIFAELIPVLFTGHLDVVEALRKDWSMDPFKFQEIDGYFYGRGTSDMKGDVADFFGS